MGYHYITIRPSSSSDPEIGLTDILTDGFESTADGNIVLQDALIRPKHSKRFHKIVNQTPVFNGLGALLST